MHGNFTAHFCHLSFSSDILENVLAIPMTNHYARGELLTLQRIAGLKVLQGPEYPPVKPALLLRIEEVAFKSLDDIPPKLIKAMYCFAAERLANGLQSLVS